MKKISLCVLLCLLAVVFSLPATAQEGAEEWQKAVVAGILISKTLHIDESQVTEILRSSYQTGKVAWDLLSEQERQNYLGGLSKLSEKDAQAIWGYELMNKYSYENMKYSKFKNAAWETQKLLITTQKADLSESEMSRYFLFIERIIQEKKLANLVTRATLEWQTKAMKQGIEVSEEFMDVTAKKFINIVASIEGGNIAMFLHQDLQRTPRLGNLQQAIMDGAMTSKQKKCFKSTFRTKINFFQMSEKLLVRVLPIWLMNHDG